MYERNVADKCDIPVGTDSVLLQVVNRVVEGEYRHIKLRRKHQHVGVWDKAVLFRLNQLLEGSLSQCFVFGDSLLHTELIEYPRHVIHPNLHLYIFEHRLVALQTHNGVDEAFGFPSVVVYVDASFTTFLLEIELLACHAEIFSPWIIGMWAHPYWQINLSRRKHLRALGPRLLLYQVEATNKHTATTRPAPLPVFQQPPVIGKEAPSQRNLPTSHYFRSVGVYPPVSPQQREVPDSCPKSRLE